MIPILYEGTETSFTTNGLGRLADAISCKVVEERNATYELEMTYPVTGVHFDDIREGRIILAKPFDGGQTQPFTIYQISKPLNQVVTVKAQHISYMLSGIVVMPFTASTCVAAIAGVKTNSSTTNPFSFTTDKAVTASYKLETPTNARSVLGGTQGSILDVYGKGDYEFDRFDVYLRVNRGSDNGVTLRYGKNITDLKNVIDITNVYTGIVPFWTDGNGDILTLTEKVVLSDHVADYPYQIIKEVDFSSNWESKPTQAQLRTAAQNYVANNEGWKLKNNITVSFVALWNTEEYKDIAPLERVKMCDVVHVQVPKLGINFETKVVKTDYNVLQEKYNSITLGETYYTLSTVLTEAITQSEEEQSSHMQKAIARATKLIQGGLGGYVVFTVNANGEPEEITIMDKPSIETAETCIRMNKNGIGFSTNGYNGPFHTAWTIDGHFVADYIDSGTLNADLIKAGVIQDEAALNYWNMVTGDFRLTSGAKIGNSTIASSADVSSGVQSAKNYAAQYDAITLANAKGYADDVIDDYDESLDQLVVFNKLTNNGAAQGIYLLDGNLYVNASVIKTGILADVNNLNYWNLQTGAFQLTTAAKIGNSTVASVADVSSGDSTTLTSAKNYADGQASSAEANAKAYAAAQDAATLSAAEVYANNGITTYDTYLNQKKVFDKLTNNSSAQGIYLSGTKLYINATYIKTGTIDASLINVTNINAASITSGYLSADRIQANTIGVNKLTGTISNSGWEINLTDGTMTIGNISAGKITSGYLSADRIAADSIGVSKLTGKISNNGWEINLSNGTMTIGNISANNINTGTLDASQVTVTNLSASSITTGDFSADRIKGGTLTISAETGSTQAIVVKTTRGNTDYVTITPNDGITVYPGSGSTKTYITGNGIRVGTSNGTISGAGVQISADSYNGYIKVGSDSNSYFEAKNGQVTITNNNFSSYALSVKSTYSSSVALRLESGSSYTALEVVAGKSSLKGLECTTLKVGNNSYSDRKVFGIKSSSSSYTPSFSELKQTKIKGTATLWAVSGYSSPNMHSDGNGGYSFSSNPSWTKIELEEASYSTKVYGVTGGSSYYGPQIDEVYVLGR